MRLYRYEVDGKPEVGALFAGAGGDPAGGCLVPVRDFAPDLATDRNGCAPGDLDELVQRGLLSALAEAAAGFDAGNARGPRPAQVRLLPPLIRPPKIWCIGLNYREHASDLDTAPPSTPVGFMRPSASIIGPGNPVRLPGASNRVTGEGELVIVLGRSGRDFDLEGARAAIGAFTLAVDMTAEDILRENPRFLTRAKSFDTFLSLGPCLVTPDEVASPQALPEVRITTLLNGQPARSAQVKDMTFAPETLLSFFSQDMSWRAGDILLTGTPGAARIADGDTIGAEVEEIGRLENPVGGPAS